MRSLRFNLDIEIVQEMVVGINDYQAALWVISHDLSQINITQSFKFREQALQMTTYSPSTPEQYYRELLECHDICYSSPV
ncbi:hypothetical protein [Nostoc sp.]|uniref:hypothetical protein n=1 Tax=Nostoc sp. TaxID=1180 RepID=UPI002FF65C55